jgi:hypothetical protein
MPLFPPSPMGNGQDITITVVPDQFHSERAWAVLDADEVPIAWSGHFAEPKTEITTLTLEAGATYTFVLLDLTGGGFQPLGNYNVTLGSSPDGDLLLGEEEPYGYVFRQTFSLPSEPTVEPTMAPSASVGCFNKWLSLALMIGSLVVGFGWK